MDTPLDIKFKQLMSEYNYKKEKKVKPFYFLQKSKHFLFKKRNIKKHLSNKLITPTNNININQQNDSSNNIIFIKLNNSYKKEEKKTHKTHKLKESRPLSLSINMSDKNTDCRQLKREQKLVGTDILQDKTFCKLGQGQLSIHSLFNKLQNKKYDKNYNKKSISVIDLNKLHNLQLTPLKEKQILRKMTKFAMLNNLYHKYSSTSSGNIKTRNIDYNKDKYYKKGNKDEFFLKNNTQIYLTYYDPNKLFNFYNIYKRNLNLPDNQQINNKIINNDRKICIDCLLSKVDSDINTQKIFPKNYGKTIYNLQKDNSYLRIQNLDNIFSKIMKKKY